MHFLRLKFRQNQCKLVSDICISGEAPSGLRDRVKVSMKKGETRVMAVLGAVVIYCYPAPVRSCIDNESYHSKTVSDESARNAT